MLTLLLALTAANAQDTGDFGDTGFVAPPVVGGSQSAPGAWPGVVAVFGSSGGACTGTLVGPRTVITAAHCGRAQAIVANTTNYYDQGSGEVVYAASTAIHPSYGTSQYGAYDIAVVTLQTAVTSATPFNLALDCAQDSIYDGATGYIVGFGLTTESGTGNNSQMHEAPIVIPDADCSEDYFCDPSVPGSEMFAGGNGVDACFGDSGGPLFVRTAAGEWTLIGVTSRSGSQATQSYPCRTGGIWTRVDYFYDWLQANSPDALTGPVCNLPPEIIMQPFGDVGNKGSSRTTYAINDPDSATWTYEIEQPTYGTIVIDGNELVFTGDGSYIGADDFVFTAIDDYGNRTDLTVPLNIVDGRVGCGCATTGTPAGLWALGLTGLLLFRRRRD